MRWFQFGLLVLALAIPGFRAQADETNVPDPDPARFARAVSTYEKQVQEAPEHPVLFYGSSSIRMWKLDEAFPGKPVLNRGFGGSQISDCIHYFDRLVKPHAPSALVFYAGDNDVDSGKGVDQVCADFTAFVTQLHAAFPECVLYYLPIKPSVARWEKWPAMKAINKRIEADAQQNPLLTYIDIATPMFDAEGQPEKSLFLKDGLHLNDSGYARWNKVVGAVLFPAQGGKGSDSGAP